MNQGKTEKQLKDSYRMIGVALIVLLGILLTLLIINL